MCRSIFVVEFPLLLELIYNDSVKINLNMFSKQNKNRELSLTQLLLVPVLSTVVLCKYCCTWLVPQVSTAEESIRSHYTVPPDFPIP